MNNAAWKGVGCSAYNDAPLNVDRDGNLFTKVIKSAMKNVSEHFKYMMKGET